MGEGDALTAPVGIQKASSMNKKQVGYSWEVKLRRKARFRKESSFGKRTSDLKIF